ncbi:hypothetical protein AA313_de0201626 [Arthrobotrys entomopaga]|nr:hypothetical protein AA313_de0201626 [Arthrobotrys entomopaga]
MVAAGRTYMIRNKQTNTCLDCNVGNSWVRAWHSKNGQNQKWILDREGQGHPWTLKNAETGRYLAPAPEGGPVQNKTPLNTTDQPHLWHLVADGDFLRIQYPDDHNLNIDIDGGSSHNDAVVILWEKGGDNQVWEFVEA